ncbi:MAG: bifunctional shikimate kinase/3-dehydroquinate synthase [Thermodesulfobacteriota bacterium]
MKDNLYITGFMGAGKSTVGRALAQALGRRFVSLDRSISRRLGMSVAQVFAERGEEAFRRLETAELRTVSRRQGLVVATGGGLPQRPVNRQLMRASGRIIFLEASLEACRRHLGPSEEKKRPLWQDPAGLAALFASRQQAYADHDLKVSVDGGGPLNLADSIAGALLPDERFSLPLDGVDCPVISTWQGPQVLEELAAGRRTVIVTDRKLARLHLARYRAMLDDPLVIAIPAGERSKTLRSAERIYKAMLQAGVERGDLLVALGGGVITDLGAFVAATYKRGLPFVLVSTTLLGCVDAAVGGKAAVDLGPAKNQVGLFTRPQAVLLDLKALATLARGQIADGLTEAYKNGLVAAPALARLVQEEMAALLHGDLLGLAQVAGQAARAKAAVVGEDFREGGRRRILNLGHTYGHALEGLSRFRLSHGQAVAAGTMVATALSVRRGLIKDEAAGRIMGALKHLLPKGLALPSAAAVWPIMQSDKKNRGGKVVFVLLAGLGRPVVVDDVRPTELQGAIDAVQKG